MHVLWFDENGRASIMLPKDADIVHVEDCGCADAIELHVIEHAEEVREDPRTFYRVRPGDSMPAAVGRGDLVGSLVHCSGVTWHIFAGQYDRGVMTKEMPAQHRAITKQAVPIND